MRAVKFGVGVAGLLMVAVVPGNGAWPPSLGWAQGAEPVQPVGADVRKRAEDLARGASDRFNELVGAKSDDANAGARAVERGLAEQAYAWISGSGRHYQTIVRKLAEPARVNPVEDAARRLASDQRRGASPRPVMVADAGLIEQGVEWVHRASRDYQEILRRLSVPAQQSGIAGVGSKTDDDARRAAEAKKAEDDARRTAEAKEADEAKQAEDARRAAEAKRTADAKKAEDDARRTAEAKKAEEAKQAEDARRAAEAKRTADAKKAEDDARRTAEAKKAEEAKQAEDARRAAEAKRTADAKKAEDDARRIAEAKEADEAKQAEDARRAAEAKRTADAKKAEDDARRTAEAKRAEEAEQTEDARRAAEATKLADARKQEAARQRADEKKAGDVSRHGGGTGKAAVSHGKTAQGATSKSKVTAGRKTSKSAGTHKTRKQRVAEAKRTKQAARRAAAERGKYAWREPRGPAGGRRGKARRARDCRFAGAGVTPPGWYVVKKHDTLWGIASRHYHKGRRYRVIYEANAGRIDNPHLIYPCQRLRIPKVHWRRS